VGKEAITHVEVAEREMQIPDLDRKGG